MELDLTTFLTTVYTIVDTIYQRDAAPHKPRHPGKKPDLSDSEVLTLLIVAQWYPKNSERAFGKYAAKHWRSYFPRLLSQSQFNRRARDLCGVLAALGPAIGRDLTAHLATPAYEVLDGVPVPIMRRCRGQRKHGLGDAADVGRGGSDKDWYYGVRLLATVNAHGLITGFVVGTAKTGERWLAEALLRWRAFPTAGEPTAEELAAVLGPSHERGGERKGPQGPISLSTGAGTATAPVYVADLGFTGEHWAAHWQDHYGARVLTTADYAEVTPQAERHAWSVWLHGLRQVVENVNDVLTEVVGLAFPRARSYWGVLTRLAAKVAAQNLLVTCNHAHDRPTFAFIDLFTL